MQTLLQPEEQQEHGLWAYISASRLNLWAKCPLAFRFRYIDEIKMPTNANLFLGQIVHAALETYYRHRQIGITPVPDDAEIFVSAAWNQVLDENAMTWKNPDDVVKYRRQAVDLVSVYINEYRSQPEKIIAMESALETPLINPATGENLGVPLFGIIDLVIDTSPKNERSNVERTIGSRRQSGSSIFTLVDFKTAASSTPLTELSHAVQLTLYSLLLQGNGYEHVETEIRQLVKTKTPKICAYRFGKRTEQQMKSFFDLCREYLDALDRGVFNFRPCWSCSMCDYRELCSA